MSNLEGEAFRISLFPCKTCTHKIQTLMAVPLTFIKIVNVRVNSFSSLSTGHFIDSRKCGNHEKLI